MTAIEHQAILTISLLAAFADGQKHARERDEIKRIADGQGQADGVHLHLVACEAVAHDCIFHLAARRDRQVAFGAFHGAVGAGCALDADLGHQFAFVFQQGLRHAPSAVQRADQICARYAHVVEEGLAELRLTADQFDGPHRDAGRGHVDQQEADALLFACCRVRAHEAENPVGAIGLRGPDLGAVDDEMITVDFGACLQAREV